MNKFSKGAVAAALVVGLGTIGYFLCTENIKPGYVGLVYSARGGIKDTVLTQGVKTVWPWEKTLKYSVATKQGYMSQDKREGSEEDDSFLVSTKSGKPVNVDLEYSYHFDSAKLPVLFTMFGGISGKEIEQTFMRGKLKAWASEATCKFEVLDMYGAKREEVNLATTQHLAKKFAPFGIVIDSINFSRIQPDGETEKAIQARVIAQQKLETIKTEKMLATQNAEKAKIEAEGAATAALVKAKGEAAVKLTQADAEAASNAKIQASLTPQLIEMAKVKATEKQSDAMSKWNVSTFINGGNSPLVNLPTVK